MSDTRLTAEQEYGFDPRIAALCDGDRFLIEAGHRSRYGGRFATLRGWAWRIPNPLYRPTP